MDRPKHDNFPNPDRDSQADRGPLSEVDFDKLLTVIRKSLLWCLFIFILTNTGAFLFVRYTKPVFQSYSDIKLDIKSEATILGINNPTPSWENLAGEIELIKSRLFFSKVIDVVDMDVTYNFYGKVLTEERYKNSPFNVEYEFINSGYIDTEFDLEIIDQKRFRLYYPEQDLEKTGLYEFGETIETSNFKFKVTLTSYFDPEVSPGKYFFVINSKTALINYLADNLEVSPQNPKAKIIRIALKDYSRNKARDLVNAIDTLYLNYTQEEKNKATKQQIDFINKQLVQTEVKLEAYEDYFENFTINNKTTNLQTDIGKTIQVLDEIEVQKFEIQTNLVGTRHVIDQVTSNKPVITSTLRPNLYPENIFLSLKELNELMQEKQMLLTSHNENTFVISKKESEIQIQRNSLLQLLGTFERKLSNELALLEKESNSLEQNFKELPSLGTQYSKNRRLYALYDEFYISQIQKKAEFEIAQAGTVTNFIILSPATLPGAPIEPQKSLIYGLGAVSGLLLSLFFVGIKYVVHNKISSQQEVENLSIAPFLGVVPHLTGENMSVTKLIIDRKPKSAVSEALRSIRTNMQFLNAEKPNKIISITSTIAGEGKTFISVNLGAIMALSDLKVVIVDLDMRKPKIHIAFSQENADNGVSTILINKNTIKDCVRKSPVKNLEYIGAGPTPPNPSELILSDNFNKFLEDLKEYYDLIILDTPPVGLVTDGILAMKQADLPIYILRADYSKKEFIRNLNRLIRVNNFKNLAVILNSLKYAKRGGYGYGYGYGYGHYYEEESVKKPKFSFNSLLKF